VDDETRGVFHKLIARTDLTRDEARRTFERFMDGTFSQAMAAALLAALTTKGECVDELVGAAEAMRARALRIECDPNGIDTCGTGGDGLSTFNVSTTAAIIAAGAGATVAKHGNRSTTRCSGSTEVLTELGIDVDADCHVVEQCLREARIGYLNARKLHPAMGFTASIREAIPVRTIFNLLGPLTNPAGVRRQVVGVPRLELLDIVAKALLDLGITHAWIVHGHDGLCDLTVTWATSVVEVRDGALRRFAVTPEEVGLQRGQMSDLLVDSPAASARTLEAVLRGRRGVAFDHAMMNAGAALVVAGLAWELRDGIELATKAVDDGAALATLEQWRKLAGRNSDHGEARR